MFSYHDSISLAPMYGWIIFQFLLVAVLKMSRKLTRNAIYFNLLLLAIVLTAFLSVKAYGSSIQIGTDRISGRYPFHTFDLAAEQIDAVRTSQRLRGGNTGSLHLKNGTSLQIPIVHGERHQEYVSAMRNFCAHHQITFDWAPDKPSAK